MSNQWFRSWHGAPTDPKWRLIAKKAEVPTSLVVSFIWALMDRASQSEDRGSFAGVDLEVLAEYLDCDETQLKRIVTQCNARNITVTDKFVTWEKRQPKREDDTSNDRVRAYRERQKNQRLNDDVTQCNAVKRTVTLDKIRVDKDIIDTNVSINNSAQQKPLSILTECLSAEVAADLIAHRRAKKSPLTAGSAKGLVKQFREYGDPEAAAQAMMANGWTGFKAEWMRSEARAGPNKTEKMSAITKALLNLENAHGNETQASGASSVIYEIPRLVGVG
jgi:hypothetical protein